MADDMSMAMNPSRDDFAALLEEALGGRDLLEGSVVHGLVTGIEKDFVVVDVGLKTEGRIAMKEFAEPGKELPKKGDTVEVFLERVENAMGEAVISREKAKREEAWTRLEVVFAANEPVNGAIVGRVKGGFTVDLGGASAFLPGSQVDIRPVRDVGPLMGKEQPFAILKMDRPRGNIVVSRRAILEEARAEQRTELVAQLAEGEVREGVVKNITDYGAFVDLGGIDGLLHVTDMSWKRVNHPSQVLAVGDTVKVQIVKINPDTQRISLGMKQLQADPWDDVEAKFPVGAKFTGRITNITDYGAFVELEAGVEGLVHVSEMSVDQEERAPRQDRVDLAGSRRGGAGRGRFQASRVARPEAGPGKPLGRLPEAAPGGLHRRRRSEERHRVRPLHRPGQRHRRHGAPVGHRLEHVAGEEAIQRYH